jgi:hypothetical protein
LDSHIPTKDDEIEPSRIGAKYVFVITDDATRFKWTYFLAARLGAANGVMLSAFGFWLGFEKNGRQ